MGLLALLLVLFVAAGIAEGERTDGGVQLGNQMPQGTDVVLRLAVFPTGTYSESYCFELSLGGVLFCAVGSRTGDDIAQPDFLAEVDQSAETLLSSESLELLISLCEGLDGSGYSAPKTWWSDSWDIAVQYDGRIYETNYWDSEGFRELAELADRLIELSPIPVDLHGWA